MGRLGFTSCRADPDVWYRLSTRSTGEEYYEYVLLYVDDVLVISEKAEADLRKEIGKDWVLKEHSIGPPSKYLGGKLSEVTLQNGVKCWAFGSCQYVQAAVNNVVLLWQWWWWCKPLVRLWRPGFDFTEKVMKPH